MSRAIAGDGEGDHEIWGDRGTDESDRGEGEGRSWLRIKGDRGKDESVLGLSEGRSRDGESDRGKDASDCPLDRLAPTREG